MRPLVILRSHKYGQKTREALAELGGSQAYDLLLSFDVTQAHCPPFFPALPFDLRLLKLADRLVIHAQNAVAGLKPRPLETTTLVAPVWGT